MGNTQPKKRSFEIKYLSSFSDIISFSNNQTEIESKNTKQDCKEILQVIDEVNKLMHFYKSILNLKEYTETFKKFSEKNKEFFKKYKDTINDELTIKIAGNDIKNYYDVYIFMNKIDDFYKDIHINKKKDFLTSIFNLLHLTLYLIIHQEFI